MSDHHRSGHRSSIGDRCSSSLGGGGDQNGYFRYGVQTSSPTKGSGGGIVSSSSGSSSGIPRWSGSLSPIPPSAAHLPVHRPRRPSGNLYSNFAYSRSSNDISSMGLGGPSDSYEDSRDGFVSSTSTSSHKKGPGRNQQHHSNKMGNTSPPISLKPPVSSTTGPFDYGSSYSPPKRQGGGGGVRPKKLDYMYYRPRDEDLPSFHNYLEELDKDPSARAMIEAQRYVGSHYQQRTYQRPSRADWFENRQHPQNRRNKDIALNRPEWSNDSLEAPSVPIRRRNSYNPPPVPPLPSLSPINLGPSPNHSMSRKKKNQQQQKEEVYNPFTYADPPPPSSLLTKDDSLDSGDLYEDHWF